ncbi:hypothetical protein CEP51_014798 [Fusarium floridanum]|uniref:Uncharacterized protein n=1 Tax=Fusarium floridanum TaxID=1325733 RepID=A0A428PLV7_9HYPO|nr:hypothetical protein CEP51_014798 [Fusarium floridanum]
MAFYEINVRDLRNIVTMEDFHIANRLAEWTAIAGSIEVSFIVALMLVPPVTVHIEIAYVVTPFTSQISTIVMMIHHFFRRTPGQNTPRPRVSGSIWVSLVMIVISIVAVVLSVTGLCQSAPMIHGILYAREPITALLSAKQAKPSPPPPDTHPEIPLALDALPNSTSSLTHGTSRPTSSDTRPAPHYSLC